MIGHHAPALGDEMATLEVRWPRNLGSFRRCSGFREDQWKAARLGPGRHHLRHEDAGRGGHEQVAMGSRIIRRRRRATSTDDHRPVTMPKTRKVGRRSRREDRAASAQRPAGGARREWVPRARGYSATGLRVSAWRGRTFRRRRRRRWGRGEEAQAFPWGLLERALSCERPRAFLKRASRLRRHRGRRAANGHAMALSPSLLHALQSLHGGRRWIGLRAPRRWASETRSTATTTQYSRPAAEPCQNVIRWPRR